MNRPSKKAIKAAIDKLKDQPDATHVAPETQVGKLSSKKSSQRIRKQGI